MLKTTFLSEHTTSRPEFLKLSFHNVASNKAILACILHTRAPKVALNFYSPFSQGNLILVPVRLFLQYIVTIFKKHKVYLTLKVVSLMDLFVFKFCFH